MLKHLPVVAAPLLLLSSTQAAALDWLGNPEGKAIGADGFKDAGILSINGTKFVDSNWNALFDNDERGLAGWVIRLKRNDREISNTTTDESGFYFFTDLEPGEYTVVEDQEAGWEQSFPGSGYYTVNLSDKSVDKVDFGSARFSKTSDGDGVELDLGVDQEYGTMPSETRQDEIESLKRLSRRISTQI